jgi:hypothetical protein
VTLALKACSEAEEGMLISKIVEMLSSHIAIRSSAGSFAVVKKDLSRPVMRILRVHCFFLLLLVILHAARIRSIDHGIHGQCA